MNTVCKRQCSSLSLEMNLILIRNNPYFLIIVKEKCITWHISSLDEILFVQKWKAQMFEDYDKVILERANDYRKEFESLRIKVLMWLKMWIHSHHLLSMKSLFCVKLPICVAVFRWQNFFCFSFCQFDIWSFWGIQGWHYQGRN